MIRLIHAITRSMNSEHTGSDVARSGEKLHEDIARQLPAQAGAGVLDPDLRFKLSVERTDLAGQHREMQQRVGMDNQKQRRPEGKKSRQRQFDIQKRQFDRVLEKQILVRNRTRRNREVEKDKNVADP